MRKFVASVALATAFVVGGLLGAVPAKAATMIGNSVTIDYLDATLNPIGCCGFPQTVTVVAGPGDLVTDAFPGGPYFSVNMEATTINWASLQDNWHFTPPAAFDGLKVSGITDTIYGVSVAGTGGVTTMPVVTFDAHDVWINFQGLGTYNTGDTVTATLDFTATPLPAALPLFAGGLGALGLLGWRKKRKSAALAAA
jgi:hypothetical protein